MKIVTRFTALALSTTILAACGGGSEPAATEETASEAAPAADAAPAPTPASAEAPAPDNTETMDGTTLAEFTPDVAHGETVFVQCQTCHALEEGVNRIGPSLYGIVGREAGSVEGYEYTPANANSGITWAPEKMFQYLENPQRVIPGTKMAFAGLPSGQDRADVIAYLDQGGAE